MSRINPENYLKIIKNRKYLFLALLGINSFEKENNHMSHLHKKKRS
jgi:hypothetical protein